MEILMIILYIVGYLVAGLLWLLLDAQVLHSMYGDIVKTVASIMLWPLVITIRIYFYVEQRWL